jgi:C_GCAxxG_C_C family probable redox protein
MDAKRIEEKAFDYFSNGFHCAEAVSKAVVESFAEAPSDAIPRVATAFGGGIGRSHEDVCGALAGGIIAIGFLFGRSQPGADWRDASESAAELRRRFLESYGTTNCKELLSRFGEQTNFMACKRLSGAVAGMVAQLVQKRLQDRPQSQ